MESNFDKYIDVCFRPKDTYWHRTYNENKKMLTTEITEEKSKLCDPKEIIHIESADLDIRITENNYIDFMMAALKFMSYLIKTDETTKIYVKTSDLSGNAVFTKVSIKELADNLTEYITLYGFPNDNKYDSNKFSTRFQIKSDKYRDIDLYRGSFGQVQGYHLPIVHGSLKFDKYQNIKLYMLPDMFQSVITSRVYHMNIFMSKISTSYDIVLKYIQRGVMFELTKEEQRKLKNYCRKNISYNTVKFKKCSTLNSYNGFYNRNCGMFIGNKFGNKLNDDGKLSCRYEQFFKLYTAKYRYVNNYVEL